MWQPWAGSCRLVTRSSSRHSAWRSLRRAGATRLVELDWWEPISQGEANVLLTPAQHFSARGVHDRNRALWGSFVVETPHIRLYFGVDSGYADHFREIGQRCGAPDVALLPIGAYEPRWFMRDMHMNPAEAVQTHLDLEARLSIAMHFGTFPLTIEGIEEPVGTLREELARRQIPDAEFRVLECGESLRMPGHIEATCQHSRIHGSGELTWPSRPPRSSHPSPSVPCICPTASSMAPMTRGQSPGGIPGPNVAAYYRRRAEHGVGLILTEGTAIDHPACTEHARRPRVSRQRGSRRLGSRAERGPRGRRPHHAATLARGHAAQPGSEPHPEAPPIGPSGMAGPDKPVSPPMSEADIVAAVGAYARSAGHAHRLGFDGIECMARTAT